MFYVRSVISSMDLKMELRDGFSFKDKLFSSIEHSSIQN